MENILVTGCSFTDKNYKPLIKDLTPLKKSWTDYINIDGNIKNVARPGVSNQEMIEFALDEIIKEKENYHRVIVGLTQWGRFKLPDQTLNTTKFFNLRYDPKIHNKDNHFIHVDEIKKYFKPRNGYTLKDFELEMKSSNQNDKWKWKYAHDFLKAKLFFAATGKIEGKFIETIIDSTLRSIIILREICYFKKIKLHVFSILEGWYMVGDSSEKLKKQYNWIDPYMSFYTKYSPLYRNLKKSKTPVNLIKFPFITELGNGEPCSATHDDRGIWHENFQLSEIDAHPNEKGYKHIANFFNENFTDYKI